MEADLLDGGGGYFRIQARHDGQCPMPDRRGPSCTDGTPAIQYAYCSAGCAPDEWSRRDLSQAVLEQ